MKFLDRLFRRTPKPEPAQPAKLGMTAHPITINPSSAQKVERLKVRLARYQESRDLVTDPAYRARMDEAIARAKAALRSHGITVEG